MSKKIKRIDLANTVVIILTFLLFASALFVKGFTHDLFLEIGIFLVSVKLIIATYHIRVATDEISKKLDKNQDEIKEIKQK